MTETRHRNAASKTTRHAVSKAARRAVRGLMGKFMQWLHALAAPHPDFVESTHQLRVTSRRADIALRVFKDWLPHDARQSLRRILKEIRFDAGVLRDLDLLEVLWRPSQGDISGQAPTDVTVWMHQQILKQRDRARLRLTHWTRKSSRSRLDKRSQRLVRRTRWRGDLAVEESLSRALEKLVNRLKDLLPKTSESLRDSHQTRIAARHLRYALELLHPFLTVDVADLGKVLTELQDHLGSLNDEATAIQHLMAVMETCHESHLLPELQRQLERTQRSAADRLAHWNTDMPGLLELLERQLSTLHIK